MFDVCLRFGFRFEGFNHCNVFAKWIQGSFGDAQEILAETWWEYYDHFERASREYYGDAYETLVRLD